MRISEITSQIERIAPLDSALDYDHPGLTVGSSDIECTGVLLCVDATSGALDMAIKNGCNLIITHHPLIFTPIQYFVSTDYRCRIIAKAMANNIAIYSAHTNIDRYCNNMSIRTLQEIGAQNITTFIDGFGAIGDTNKTFLEITNEISNLLDDNRSYTVGNLNDKVQRIAMINGAGSDEDAIMNAINAGADLFISGEFKHHILLMAKENGLKLMSVGHYASEKSFMSIINDSIMRHFDIKTIKYYEGNPYN